MSYEPTQPVTKTLTTRNSSGEPTDAVGMVIAIYRDNLDSSVSWLGSFDFEAVPVFTVTGVSPAHFGGGWYHFTIVPSDNTAFQVEGNYFAVVTDGTVDGTSIVHEVVFEWTVKNTISEIVNDLAAAGSVSINRAVVGGTITLWVNADYTIAHDRSVDVTVPAGTFPDLSLADAVYLGVTTTKDNTLGFTIEASSVAGSATLAQVLKFEPNHTDHTTVAKIDPAYSYVGEVLAVYLGTPNIYEPVMKLKVVVEANRVTVPTP